MGKRKDKDIIEDKEAFSVMFRQEGKGIKESSQLFCDKIEYWHNKGEYKEDIDDLFLRKGHRFFDHHLMFYRDKKLIFKIWLKNHPNSKEYKEGDVWQKI